MKKLLMTMMAVMALTTVQAQVTPNVLGEKHVMLRLEQGKKYILYASPCP